MLTLMGVYLVNGTKSLLTYWRVLIIYQAFVLTVLTITQILTHAPEVETSRLAKAYNNMHLFWKQLLVIFGLVKYEDPIWLYLLPYVIFFSLSVILLANIRKKHEVEQRRLFS